MKAARPSRSLDTPAYANDAEPEAQVLVDNIASDLDERNEEEEAKARLIKEDVSALLSTLHPRERNVIRMRYGLHSPEGKAMTLYDIGAAYGLTRERIRQIEDKALNKLKRPWRRQLLRSHFDSASPARPALSSE